jgi:hypothetical protein
MRIKPLILTINLNGCHHQAQNLVNVSRPISLQRLASKISRNNVLHSVHKDSTVPVELL